MKNEPAFPRLGLNIQDQSTGEFVPHDPGMTLRDYFAAKAMAELIHIQSQVEYDSPEDRMASVANISYKMADAMLKQRSV